MMKNNFVEFRFFNYLIKIVVFFQLEQSDAKRAKRRFDPIRIDFADGKPWKHNIGKTLLSFTPSSSNICKDLVSTIDSVLRPSTQQK